MSKCRLWNLLWTIVFAFPLAVRAQAGSGFVCMSAGRFPDPTSCSRYYSCFLDPTTGNLLLSQQTCPGTSIFNPTTAKCTAAGGAFTCSPTTTIATTTTTTTPTTTTSQTTTTTSTTTETATTTAETTTTPKPTTTKKTTTPKTTTTRKTTTPKTTTTTEKSTTTTTPVPTTTTTTPATTTTTASTTTTTPSTTALPITTTSTTATATIPATTSTSTAVLTEATTIATIRADEGCVSPGRYPEPTDCSRYYACFRDPSTGELIRSNYTCPGTSIFNPATSKCTASGGSFTCVPTTVATTTSTTSTTTDSTSTSTTTETTTTTQTTTPTSTSTTTITTTTASACDINGFLCPTSTSFQLCSGGQPIGDPVSCSSGLFCSESCPLFCVEDISTC